ncbi:TatD family [Arabidopsis suecica]|uniref:TatD family n=1 Tax=Arabidopsis suecica TaxID=45249 RepID=A0A8T1Z4H2_ARASU|nr:TatD family [Arabidopsis suecica]
MNKPVAVHCIDAFDDLLEIMRSIGPFPAGVILHSFNGSAEVVPKLNELGAYLSFSGWFTYIDEKIGKKTLKSQFKVLELKALLLLVKGLCAPAFLL